MIILASRSIWACLTSSNLYFLNISTLIFPELTFSNNVFEASFKQGKIETMLKEELDYNSNIQIKNIDKIIPYDWLEWENKICGKFLEFNILITLNLVYISINF